jgi:hypothetical protein
MMERANQLSKEVIGATIEVHRHLGAWVARIGV